MRNKILGLSIKAKIIALIVAAVLISASLAIFVEAGQGSRAIAASGVLGAERVAVSVPTDLALLVAVTDKIPSNSMTKQLMPVGTVNSLKIEPGSHVKKGDVLLTVSEEMALQNLNKAQAQYDNLSATIDSLNDSRNDLSKKRSDLDTNEASLRANRAKAINDFNEKYAAGQAQIKQLEAQLAALKTKGGNPAQIAQLEATISQARAGQEAGKKQFDKALGQMDLGLAKISQGKRQIDEGNSALARKIALLEKRRVQAETGLALARRIVDSTKIRAGASGMITEMRIAEGSVLYPGQRLMSIIQTDKLRIDLYIPLDRIKEVRIGDPAEALVDAAPDVVFKGKVVEIGQKAIFAPSNITTDELELVRVVKVTVEIGNKQGILKAGMPVDVKIF
ncbi:MAG: HlyD family secretion protein [Firmicutes bacterium]|nr:HlyD family secretion protein [Bacillota bacterium]